LNHNSIPTTLFVDSDRIVARGRAAWLRPLGQMRVGLGPLHLPVECLMTRVPEDFDTWAGRGASGALTGGGAGAGPGTVPASMAVAVDAADRTAIYPNEGAWWNPAEPGTGWVLEVDEITGFLFLTWYTYEADGDPIYYLLQGPLQMRPERDRVRGAPWATLSGPLSVVRGGQAPGQPHRPPQVADAGLGNAEVRFFDARRGEFRLGGRVTPIRVFTTATPEVDLLAGTWGIRYRAVSTVGAPTVGVKQAVIRLERVQGAFPFHTQVASETLPVPAASAFLWDPPPASAVFYRATCVRGCTPAGDLIAPVANEGRPLMSRVANWVFWYDPPTGRYGQDVFQPVTGRPTPNELNHNSVPTTLFVHRNRVVGRGRYALNPNADGSGRGDLRLPVEYIMTRVPAEFETWLGRNPPTGPPGG
jgi:hypothetical protein